MPEKMGLTESARIERKLAARAAKGDRDAFGELFDLNVDYIMAVARKLTREEALAEDLTQDAFIAAWRAIGSFRSESRFKTWLCRITFNLWWSARRKESARALKKSEFLNDPTLHQGASNDPESIAIKREGARIVETLLAKMDPCRRLAYTLYEFQRLSYEEISIATGVAVGTTRSRISRARDELEKIIERYVAQSPV